MNARPRVKICGHTRSTDIAASVRAGADAVGVISEVAVETPRAVDLDQARDLLATLPPFVAGVLVTMADSAEPAIERVKVVDPDALQVHGSMPESELESLVASLRIPVIPALSSDALDRIGVADTHADAILIDSVDAAGGGGTGRTHDWKRTKSIVESVESPVILAGGLTPENVGDAIATVGPFGVDVASGVESRGGTKDHDSVARFVMNAMGGVR